MRNFQDQVIAVGSTDAQGLLQITPKGVPFYMVAKAEGEVGYLKLSRGTALPVSHFDVGGETLTAGLKGFIYGERGVWRPGDDIHLTFLLQDASKRLPANHPASLALIDPQGRLVQTLTQAAPVDGFYSFKLKTADDAVTGNYTAKVKVGGAEFSKTLKVETVMPNRLKVDLRFDNPALSGEVVKAKLVSQWLTGATAAGLKADVSVKMHPVATQFGRYSDFSFDDATRSFNVERSTVFEGKLNAEGEADLSLALKPESASPGKLEASFTTRIFEPSGAFSTAMQRAPFSPYARYVGLKTPKGDAARKMLLTDIDHPLEVVTVDADGKPVDGQVKISFYKVQWKWWWEQNGDSAAEFASGTEQQLLREGSVSTKNGAAVWKFQVKYPDWGRYLMRACDTESGHCATRVFYMDWPGWAGRAQEESGPAASALQFFADKPEYRVGDTAKLQLPQASQGRALLTVETGSRVLSAQWLEFGAGKPLQVQLPITSAMSPTAYVAITLLQPHQGKNNDRPIRLYGVIPLKVSDPKTLLKPVVTTADLWRPNSNASITVAEQAGRAMTYTLAVVDEGLLGLTAHKTPDPHPAFYQREALGVMTWDLFDAVAGAYGTQLERLLALGGDAAGVNAEEAEQKRFPPVVEVLGPFQLAAGARQNHSIALGQYIGAVRVMVVAGKDLAYGSAEKTVTVRDPVSVLATLPRVLGPGEKLRIPVSVFAFEPDVQSVQLRAETRGALRIAQPAQTLSFAALGEQIAYLDAEVGDALGFSRFTISAVSGKHRSSHTVNIEVRAQNPAVATVTRSEIAAGSEWSTALIKPAVKGGSSARLQVSAVPPFGLDQRLQELIRYPHGCVEQLTSATLPQLYVPGLAALSPKEQEAITRNVNGGLAALQRYQQSNGSFAYWPMSSEVNDWANNYVGHLLVEAKRLGYFVPPTMLDSWLSAQRTAANAWTTGSGGSVEAQAYRLYTLALADRPEVAAMNRLRDQLGDNLLARWQLASAYARAGLIDAASEVAGKTLDSRTSYSTPGATFGSTVRDQAVLLDTLLLLKDQRRAAALSAELAVALNSDGWLSTQSTGYGLMALAHRYLGVKDKPGFAYQWQLGNGKAQSVTVDKQVTSSQALPAPDGSALRISNGGKQPLYASLIQYASPAPGQEKVSAQGLSVAVEYIDVQGNALTVARIPQGTDFIARISVRNTSKQALDDLALTAVMAAGWELHTGNREDEPAAPATAAMPADGSAPKPKMTSAHPEFRDLRDDRLLQYFPLKSGESRRFEVRLNASYLGRYYLPGVVVESMYDASRNARGAGQWVEVVAPKG